MLKKPFNGFELGTKIDLEQPGDSREVLEPAIAAYPEEENLLEDTSSGGEACHQKKKPSVNPTKAILTAKKPKPWGWLIVGISLCGIFGGGIWAIWSLTTPPPSADCRKAASGFTDMERLYCAQESARSGELPKILAGMDLLSQWKPDHPLYREAQRLIKQWSEPVIAAARQRVEASDLNGGIELASHIPKGSPAYKEAQTAIAQWKRFWKKGEDIVAAARKAMKASNWDAAEIKIATLREFSQDYWRFDRANALSQMLTAERQGRQLTTEAKTLAQMGQADQLGSAIATLSRMNSKTYAWADAQPVLAQWSETLLNQSFQNLLKGNLRASATLAEKVLPNPNLTQTAQDLLWLGQARSHALSSQTSLKPTLPQLWNLSAAISTTSQIKPDSRYYQQSQANLKSWLAQFQDLTWLQTAYEIGEVQQLPALQLALWQGQQVTRDRPRRAQAQTLLAYWQQNIYRLEDRPYLIYAQALAGKGTIPAFKGAIAQAALISSKRPLRQEAQTLIAAWTAQIQAIEDRPILDQAWAMANQGQLNEAIRIAGAINPGRALYGEAQSTLAAWQAQIQAAIIARQKERERELDKQLRDRNLIRPQQPDYNSNDNNPDSLPREQQAYPDSPYPAPIPSIPSPAGSSAPPSEPPPPPPTYPSEPPPPPPRNLVVPTEPVPPPPPQ
jgi:hypothetical protein